IKHSARIEDRVHQFLEIAKRILEVDGCHLPKVFFYSHKKLVRMIEPDFPEHQDKPAIWFELAKLAKKSKATSVICIAESWMARREHIPPGKRPEDSPERVEVLQVAALTRFGKFYTVLLPFTRTNDGIKFGDEIVLDDEAYYSGFLEPFKKIWRGTI